MAFIRRAIKRNEDIVQIGRTGIIYLINHPDYVKELLQVQHKKVKQGRGHRMLKQFLGEGLLTSDGERHNKDRRAIQPEFHRKRIAGYAAVMAERSQKYISQWSDGEEIEIGAAMKELTLAIVMKTLFGAELKADMDKIKTAGIELQKTILKRTTHPFGFVTHYIPLPSSLRFRMSVLVFDRIIYRLIAEKKLSKTNGEDLISMLLSLEAPALTKKKDKKIAKKIRDQILTFFLAGHETTANSLTWTCYLLAKHPKVQAELYAEIKEVLQDRAVTLGDIPQLEFTAKVFKESLRLYPPVWAIGRTAIADFEIGPYPVRKGWECIVSPYLTQRDSRWFAKADEFIPERWTDSFEKELPRCAYFPFGFGPRQCIGESFAKLEAMIILAHISQNWKLYIDSAHTGELLAGITLAPKHGITLRLERRRSP